MRFVISSLIIATGLVVGGTAYAGDGSGTVRNPAPNAQAFAKQNKTRSLFSPVTTQSTNPASADSSLAKIRGATSQGFAPIDTVASGTLNGKR